MDITIATPVEDEFINAELEYYDHIVQSAEDFKWEFVGLYGPCEHCGNYYWIGCAKRCKCDES